jgi:predicted nucleic acid-binding protein
MKIYLDACCLCRPFDNQTKGRIHRESAAVREIIQRCTRRKHFFVTSEAISEEISHIPDPVKRLRVEKIASMADEFILIDDDITYRMACLVNEGCDAMDALHIACAERAGAVLLTTDDGLITFFKSHRDIQISIVNPVTWLGDENE